MSQQIQTQAAKVWQTIAAPETAATYQKTGTVTWSILKETGYLLWLVVCLVLVAGEWIWKTGYGAGYGFREWLNNFERPSPDRLLSVTGQTLLETGKTSFAAVLSTAKDQLGIEPEPTPEISPAPPALPSPPTPPFTPPIAPTSVELDEPPATDPLDPLS